MASTSLVIPGVADGDLLALLRRRLSGEQQQLFLSSFAAYVQSDPENDFVIPLGADTVKWLGYRRKDVVVRALQKALKEGTDYRVFHFPAENPLGGRPTQEYLLTPNGFKQLCMVADTTKARQVREYYIAMESVVFQWTRQRMAALSAERESARALLESRDAELAREREAREAAVVALEARDAELARLREKTYDPVPRDDHVYVCKERAELASDRHKVGKAVDTRRRESQLNTGSAQGSKIVYKRATHNAKIVEDIVGIACRRYWYRAEHYNCRMDHSIDVIDIASAVVDTLASSYEHIARADLYAKVIGTLQADAGESRNDGDDVVCDADADKDKDDEEHEPPVVPPDGDGHGAPAAPDSAPPSLGTRASSRRRLIAEDRLVAFLRGCCKADAGATAKTVEFLDAYNRWAAACKAPRFDDKKMAAAMGERGFAKKPLRGDGGRCQRFVGVAFDPERFRSMLEAAEAESAGGEEFY